MLAGVYLLTMFRPDAHSTVSLGNLGSSYSSIDDMIRGSQRQILGPWQSHRRSESSIGSGADRDRLLGGNGEEGSEVELARLNDSGKITDRLCAGIDNTEIRNS